MSEKSYTFEEGVAKLEEISNSFKAENLNLEKNLENFELACQIYEDCLSKLEKAKNTIQIVNPENLELEEYAENEH